MNSIYTPEQQQALYGIHKATDKLIPAAAGSPDAINSAIDLIREWGPGTAANPVTWTKDKDVRQRNGIPYKCNQTHTHHGEPGWGPGENDALWSEYHGTSPETARPYKQPLGAHDAYRVDEYAIEGGKVYRCKVDVTDRPPSVLPGHWEAVGGGTGTEPGEPDNPDEPTPALPQAWDDFPANHLFAVGDEFSDGGKAYLVKRVFYKQEHMRPPAFTGDYYVIVT